MPGTRRKAPFGRRFYIERLPYHAAYHFGYTKGRHTKRSAGITLLLGKRFREKNVVAVTYPPEELGGRGGALRVRHGPTDFKLIGGYVPPFSGSASHYPQWQTTVRKTTNWMWDEVQRIPTRCTPFLFLDLNDGLGLGGPEREANESIGPIAALQQVFFAKW